MNINNRIIINENMTMNQIIHITVFCLAVCLLSACGEKKITVKGTDGTEYESYQECCEAQDFQAAHQFLAKMKNAIIEKESSSEKYQAEKMFNEAKEEVFKQEALFLMSQNNEEAQSRILYLLKEEGDNTDHIDMLVDLAIENDDEAYVKRLTNLYKKDVDDDILKQIVEYLSSKKTEENKDFLMSLLKRLDEESLLLKIAIRNEDKVFVDEYLQSHTLSIDDEDIMNYLAASKEKKYTERIIATLTKMDAEISQKPKMGKTEVGDNYGKDKKEFIQKCNSFKEGVEELNNSCMIVLSIAIKNKNQYLAQRAVSMVKSNIHVENPQYFTFIVREDNEDIANAKKTYNEAVRSGAFK